MKRFLYPLLLPAVAFGFVLSSACSRDPNVRKQKYVESGQRYLEKANYPGAAIQFGNAVQVDPGYAKAHYGLAQVYLKTQNWGSAYHELSRTIDLDPENYTARVELSNLLVEGGDLKQAREHADYLLAHRPNDFQSHVVFAQVLASQGDLPVAVQELQKAISLRPTEADPYLDLALLQLRMQQFDSAEANFKKAVEANPNSIATRLALGKFYQSRNRFPEAEQQYRQAMDANPKSPEPRSSLVALYVAQKRTAEAIKLLEQTKKDLSDDSVGYRMLGDFYFATGDVDKALTEYQGLYQDHSKDLQVKKNYIQLLLLKDRLDEAKSINDTILKAAPNDVESLIYQGQIQTRDGHPNDAVTTLQRVIKNDPENGLAYYHMGNAYARLGNLRQAESGWNQAVQLRPNLADAHRALAGAAIRKGDMLSLERAATQLISLQPSLPDGYALRALAFTNRGQFSQAESDAAKAREVAPAHPAGYVGMGNVRMAQKRFKEAETSFQQALVRDPASFDALKSLMQVYVIENQLDKAIEAARSQIALVPTSANFYYLLATGLLEKKDLEGARAALKASTDLDHNNTDAFLKLAQVEIGQGRDTEALSTCQRALQANPREPGFYVLLGQIYESRKDAQKANDAYRSALEIAPEDPLASNNLAYSMLQNGGNLDIALSLAQVAKRGMPDSYNVADTLGWAFYQKGAYKSAIDSFRESLSLMESKKLQDDPSVHYHLGLAYERSGQSSLARQQLERVLKIDPSASNAAEVRKHLSEMQHQ